MKKTEAQRPSELLPERNDELTKAQNALAEAKHANALAQRDGDFAAMQATSERVRRHEAEIPEIQATIGQINGALIYERHRDNQAALPAAIASHDLKAAAVELAQKRYATAERELLDAEMALRQARNESDQTWFRISDLRRKIDAFELEHTDLLTTSAEGK